MSKIASACSAEKPNFSTSPAFAAAVVFEPLIREMISSSRSRALSSPSTMCSLASERLRRNTVRRLTTSRLCPIKQSKTSFRLIVAGAPSTRARMLPPKVPESWVDDSSRASTAFGSALF